MIRGLWISAAALDPAAKAQEILANNLANVQTGGFRQDRLAFHRVAADALGAPAPPPFGPAADTRVAAPILAQTVDLSEGTVETTSNPEHVALQGPGFFAVQGPSGELYTRDGSLHRGTDGTVLHQSGYPLLTDSGPLVVPPDSEMVVGSDGTVFVDGTPRGRLKVVSLPDPTALRHAGRGLIASDQPGVEDRSSRVVQGALESGNVDPVGSMVEMMSLVRTYEANQRAILTQDQSLGRLISWASG